MSEEQDVVFPPFPTINANDPHLDFYLEAARRQGAGIAVDNNNSGKHCPAPPARGLASLTK